MGSKAWNQTVPWESDLSAALARAQEATIRDGVYAQSYTPELPPRPTPADVRAAFDCDGSGSVVDIVRLEDAPGPEVAGPFADEVLLDLFETTKPTREAFMAKYWEMLELLGRGEIAYVVLYEGEQPKELLFLGHTAD